MRHASSAVLTVLSTALFATGCGSTIDPSEDGFGDSASYSAEESGTGGIHKTDVGPGLLDPGECLADPKMDAYGYKYQCDGWFIAHVHFIHDGDSYTIYIPAAQSNYFGETEEPYEEAKVIACCGEFDRNVAFDDQPPVYVENCLLDFRQQACISIATGLAALINDGTIPDLYKAKAIDVQNYIAGHTQDCTLGLFPDIYDDPEILGATWELPDDGPWSPQASNVQLVIDAAVINGLNLPAEPDTCEGLDKDDMYPFSPDPQPLPHVDDVTLDDGSGGLFGPSDITGTATFASLSTICADPFCSQASFSTIDSKFAIDSMQLRVAGALRITDGEQVEWIANARLELYSQAFGSITGGGRAPLVHTIDAGAAQFLIVGEAAGEWVTIPVLTSTPIVAHESAGEWSLDPFSLEFVDDVGSTWTLTVGASEWL